MRGITIIFNNSRIHTGDDLDLVQEKKNIGKPSIQSYTVQVPGRNGLLNLTKSLTGKVVYNNRSLSFQYFGTGDRERLLYLDDFMSQFHGETIRIIDDDYPDHYYEGEASVETVFNYNYVTITLTIDAQPFRLKTKTTVKSNTVSGETVIRLINESIPAIPAITVNVAMTVTLNGVSKSLTAGTHTVNEFELQRGANEFTVSGTGTISFEYQEGAI